MGMKDVEVTFTGQEQIMVEMQMNSDELEATVVTGIFTRKKDSYTGAVQTVTSDEIKRVGNQNVLQSLKSIDPSLLVVANLQEGSNPNSIASMSMLSAVLCLASCEKWLKATSSDKIAADDLFSYRDGFKDALTGVYLDMGDEDLYGGNATWFCNDLAAFPYILQTTATFKCWQGHTYSNSVAKPYISSMWLKAYNTIANINLILRYADSQQGVLPNYEKNLIKGELYGLRAYIQFDMIGTDKHLFALDPLTYKIASKDAKLFNFIDADVFNTTCIFNFADYICGTVVNGILYVTVANGTNTYSKLAYNVSSNNTVLPSNIAYGKPDQGVITHFNPAEHKFYSIHGWASMTGGLSEDFPTAISFKLSDAECVAAGATRNACLAFILKTTDGSYHILVQDPSLSTDSFTEFDLTAPEIDKAVSFAFCDNCDVIYYATESTVYAIIMSGGKTTVRKLNWAPDDSEEKISIIQQYQQAWWGTQQLSNGGYNFTLPYHRLQIIIATYDESKGEGKIYLRPFNVSTGLFTFKSNGTYDGFGKIESITTSFR